MEMTENAGGSWVLKQSFMPRAYNVSSNLFLVWHRFSPQHFSEIPAVWQLLPRRRLIVSSHTKGRGAFVRDQTVPRALATRVECSCNAVWLELSSVPWDGTGCPGAAVHPVHPFLASLLRIHSDRYPKPLRFVTARY